MWYGSGQARCPMASACHAGPIRPRDRCCCLPSSADRQSPVSPWSEPGDGPCCRFPDAGRGSLASPRSASSSGEMPRLPLPVHNTASILPVCCVRSLPRAGDRGSLNVSNGSRRFGELRTNHASSGRFKSKLVQYNVEKSICILS